jgi:hypothetical protein
VPLQLLRLLSDQRFRYPEKVMAEYCNLAHMYLLIFSPDTSDAARFAFDAPGYYAVASRKQQ